MGWRNSAYFTDTWRYPILRNWIASELPRRRIALLSIGCGTGELEIHLGNLGHRVVGLDISHEMLRSASRYGLTRLIQADAHCLPFMSECFDVVLLMECIGHLGVRAVLRQVHRVLKDKGWLFITTYPAHLTVHATYRKRGINQLAKQLEYTGFCVSERRFLNVKRKAVDDAVVEDNSNLIYLRARKKAAGKYGVQAFDSGERPARQSDTKRR